MVGETEVRGKRKRVRCHDGDLEWRSQSSGRECETEKAEVDRMLGKSVGEGMSIRWMKGAAEWCRMRRADVWGGQGGAVGWRVEQEVHSA